MPGDGEPTHYLRRDQLTDLRSKLVGELHGSCNECERRSGPTDGLVSAHYDNFVLRAKAQALVSIAQGSLSLRGAAHEVRVATIERRSSEPSGCRATAELRQAAPARPTNGTLMTARAGLAGSHPPTGSTFDLKVAPISPVDNPQI